MLSTRHLWLAWMVGVLLGALTASSAVAQNVTTGTISGTAVDPQSAVLPGATVNAVHEPTGTKYEAVTGTEGRYQILNMRVGGP